MTGAVPPLVVGLGADNAVATLEAVLHGLAEAVTVMDAQGQAVYANDAAIALLRLGSARELLDAEPGAIMDLFEVYDEAGAPVDLHRLPGFRVLAGERDPDPLLVRNVVKATGEERWLLNRTTTILDTDGKLMGVANVIEDVTAVKRAELAQRLLAEALQRGLRPPELPAMPGLATASHYRAAGELNEVGGDFYDAFPAGDGWMVVIGDVAGQGAEAATLTGLARYTLRTAGQLTGDPARAMAQLNATLRGQHQLSLCTAVCALVQIAGETATVELANCGHPRPLLLRDGTLAELGEPGPMAGAFDDGAWPGTRLALRPGDTLLLYTDGVLDAVGAADRFGAERLHDALRTAPSPHPPALVEHLAAALDAFQVGAQRDDTAIVALRFLGAG
jgi:phosphoserine phosphatase RsbU/P